MPKETLLQLLQDVKLLLAQEKVRQNAKEERGENFNAFSVIGLTTQEVELHSPFIAELLNPQGSHGLKDAFLKAFITEVCKEESFFSDTATAEIKTEYFAGTIGEDSDGDYGGRIDILIRNKNQEAIIIENKINAEDGDRQLLRYYNFGKENYIAFKLVYLTKEGLDPSTPSTGDKEFDYVKISYREHILNWLNRCVELSACYPSVREIIRQYILTIKDFLYIMDNQNDILDVLTSEKNKEITLSILERKTLIDNRIREDFGEQLKKVAAKYGWEMRADDGVFRCENDTWIRFSKEGCFDRWFMAIGVYKHTNAGGYLLGIRTPNRSILKRKIWESSPKEIITDEWPFGCDYLWGNEKIFWRWDDPSTLRAMVNGDLAKYIEEELFKVVKENGLIEELERRFDEIMV